MSKLPRPFDRWTTYEGHGGIDYGVPRNTPVPASGPGFIDFSGYYSDRGGYAKFIQYDCGCRHGYYHFDREQGLPAGTRVDYGTLFALSGGLGQYSTGPHLHHEVWNGHSSIIRPPAYWDYVDRDRYVGDGSTAGGEATEFTPNPITEGTNMILIYNSEQASQLVLVTADGGQLRARYLEDPAERAVFAETKPPLSITRCDPTTFAAFLARCSYVYGAPIPLLDVNAVEE